MLISIGAWKFFLAPRLLSGIAAAIWCLGLLATPVMIMLTAMLTDAPGTDTSRGFRALMRGVTVWPWVAGAALLISLAGLYFANLTVSLVGLLLPVPVALFLFLAAALAMPTSR